MVGTITWHTVYRSPTSHAQCNWIDIWLSVQMENNLRRIPEIVYIIGIDNTMANAISCLDITLAPPAEQSEQQNWMTFTKCWCNINQEAHNKQYLESKNCVFANVVMTMKYPLTVKEKKILCALKKEDKYENQLVENTEVLCKDEKLVILKSLQHRTVSRYYHYLKHLDIPI